jgi:hypothetical protein
VARSLKLANDRGIPLFVVGVGTTGGGPIPEPPPKPGAPPPLEPPPPLHSALDRASLVTIATAGGGQYFELDREGDREIANRIIEAGRRRAGSRGLQSGIQEIYWQCLLAAAAFIAIGVLFLQDREELWLHSLAAGATLFIVWTMTR